MKIQESSGFAILHFSHPCHPRHPRLRTDESSLLCPSRLDLNIHRDFITDHGDRLNAFAPR
jgi:hypothetical protein